MTNKYLKVCPRGFVNEVLYLRVPETVPMPLAEEEAERDFIDRENGYVEWSRDKVAHEPGVAVDWADRLRVM